MNIVTAILILCLLSFTVYLIFKIYKLVQLRDPTLLLSVVSIGLSLACMETFCIMDSLRMFADADSPVNTWTYVTWQEQVDSLKVMFLYSAFMFDLYKWCLFIIATREYNM